MSDERLIYIEGWERDDPNFQEFLKRLKAPPAKHQLEPALAAAVKKATPSRFWSAIRITDYYRDGIPQLGAFEDIVMTSKMEGDRKRLKLTFTAQGKNRSRRKKVAAELMDGVRLLVEELEEELPEDPSLKSSIDFLNEIESDVSGKVAKFSMTIDRSAVEAAAVLIELFGDDF